MKIIFLLLTIFFFEKDVLFGQESIQIGKNYTIKSAFLEENRSILVYEPNHFDSTKHYSVIYLLDEGMEEDFLHVAGLVQFFQLQFACPDFILVGIKNVDRKRDFTYKSVDTNYQKNFPTSGKSEPFISFIRQELIPFVDSKYKTSDEKYLIGQSLGGLLATEILFRYPTTFSHYLIVSPSLWWDNELLLKANKKNPFSEEVQFVSISVGADEHRIMKREAKKLARITRHSKVKQSHFHVLRKEDHATVLHRALYHGFRELFPVKQPN